MPLKHITRRSLGAHPDTRPEFEPRETRYERLVRIAFTLRRIGVSEQEAARLIRSHSAQTIDRLLRDVPWRRARNRAAYLVSAIDNEPTKAAGDAAVDEPVSPPR